MARPKKIRVRLNMESLESLMQEIYFDCQNVRQKAQQQISAINNEAEKNDTNDIYQVAKVTNEALKIIDSTVEKKLALAKLQSQVITSKSPGDERESGMSEEDKKLIRELIEKKSTENNVQYEVD